MTAAQDINIYCDESCHLENDHQKVMVLGAVSCPRAKSREIADRLREIKGRHGLASTFEAKWTKVSPAKVQLYLDLIDYFFDDDDLGFRGLVVPDKSILDHAKHQQDHDAFYYKLYFDLLKVILDPECAYRIYLDIKDTKGAEKVRKLHTVLANSLYDFDRAIVRHIQTVRSEEVQQLQLADLLIGALSYANRGLGDSSAKTKLVERVRERSGYTLNRTTLLREKKFNLLAWRPKG